MKKIIFTAFAVCAFSTATFAVEVKEVAVDVVVNPGCDAAWIAVYHDYYTSGSTRQEARDKADMVERACKNALKKDAGVEEASDSTTQQ
ncbi:hypothetical protein ACFSX9_14620 [Flavobacterium ardleyense]|uniref:Uncharacterized protein n=1 Tax=Flavobacterium ardleyense TaxID=2038737 RepID=A0ABW5ZD10_9FLAO